MERLSLRVHVLFLYSLICSETILNCLTAFVSFICNECGGHAYAHMYVVLGICQESTAQDSYMILAQD